MADTSNNPFFTLVLDDPECRILLDTVAQLARLDCDGAKLPPGVKHPTDHNIAVAALRQGLKAMAAAAVARRRVGVRHIPLPSVMPYMSPDNIAGVDS
ncbi:hypothetical protein [Polyangium mundeleinium]|uniref:Uncharacterized protein n=1 Tax=Polyangium mundeleinium TaxID=2995306 RepID=A0ABT5EEA7_9BACT|nr:hypothetical protein [Polyangium mundeleinium]MDC0740146.1 hypothetical protein [Polyangium mundeleinium]